MVVLGIETSCDETGVAIIDADRNVRADLVLSQVKDHAVFGGVVPEIAARSHLDHLDKTIAAALSDAGLTLNEIDAVAAVCGPGLIGGVMVGMMTGKAMAAAMKKPFIAVNHLEAHLLSPRLTDDIPFPYLVLLVSGGHSQIILVKNIGQYRCWSTTRDDAAGECFDKAAKLMGLPYPGGPNLEKLAAQCADPAAAEKRFSFSIPMEHEKDMDFSFSGLKTGVRHYVDRLLDNNCLRRGDLSFLAHSFQNVIARTLAHRVKMAMARFRIEHNGKPSAFVVCGGVAANTEIRTLLKQACADEGFSFHAPPLKYCTDNGAMVAWAGVELLRCGRTSPFDTRARPRWPLEEILEKDSG